MSCASIMNEESSEILVEDPTLLTGERRDSEDAYAGSSSTTSSSSMGKNSNLSRRSSSSSSVGKNNDLSRRSSSQNEVDSGVTDEVQSPYKGSGPLHAMGALEEVLPIRRGISRFYDGKSKSFASLADVSSSSSVKDITKPENTYTRRRRNLLASCLMCEKNKNSSQLKSNGAGISKRFSNSGRTTLALAVAMSNSGTNNDLIEDSNPSTELIPPSSSSHLNLQCGSHRQPHCNILMLSSVIDPEINVKCKQNLL